MDWVGTQRIIEKGNADNQYRLYVDNGTIKFDLAGIGVVTQPLYTLTASGGWYLVTATYDGTTAKLYLQNQALTTPLTGLIAKTNDPLIIGGKNGSPVTSGDYFRGVIDDVRIYNRALTQDEVQVLYLTT